MATPLYSFPTRVCTKRNTNTLINPTPDPEKVFRVRLNRLSSRAHLDNLGQEALSNIHSLFSDPIQQDIMDDLYLPCNFSNIQGYPRDLPTTGMDKLSSFQGNNAVIVKDHLNRFRHFINKWGSANVAHEDVRMKLFVLSLEEDALKWFTKRPDHSFNSLQALTNAFKDRFGDKREESHLVKALCIIKKKENETVEEFNKRFNGIVKELPQDYKPPDKSLRDFYIDAFNDLALWEGIFKTSVTGTQILELFNHPPKSIFISEEGLKFLRVA